MIYNREFYTHLYLASLHCLVYECSMTGLQDNAKSWVIYSSQPFDRAHVCDGHRRADWWNCRKTAYAVLYMQYVAHKKYVTGWCYCRNNRNSSRQRVPRSTPNILRIKLPIHSGYCDPSTPAYTYTLYFVCNLEEKETLHCVPKEWDSRNLEYLVQF